MANSLNPRRVRIVSDGLLGGTRVFVDDEPLLNATKATWAIDADTGYATATLTLIGVEVDVTVEACTHDQEMAVNG